MAFHILPALKNGRKVITNLPLQIEQIRIINPDWVNLIEIRKFPSPIKGTWDADAASRGELAFKLFVDGHEEKAPDVPVFGHVWDFYDTWRGKDGIGPLYVVDECHNAWPKTLMPQKELKEVIQWAKLSRHFGADVTGITQSWRDVHGSLSMLLASLIKLRKADIIGNEGYIRKVHAGFRGALLSDEQRKYDPTIFPFYRSHTQGQAVSEAGLSDVNPLIKKFRRYTYAVWAFAIAFAAWAFWPNDEYNIAGVRKKPPSEPVPKAQQASIMLDDGLEPIPVSLAANPAASAPQAAASEPEPEKKAVDPLEGKLIHMTGYMQMGTKSMTAFVVSMDGKTFFEVTDKDLTEAGYTWKRLAHCLGVLEFPGAKDRPVTCDAPILASGGQDRPVVMDSFTGAYSDGRHERHIPAEDYAGGPQTLIIPHTKTELGERYSVASKD